MIGKMLITARVVSYVSAHLRPKLSSFSMRHRGRHRDLLRAFQLLARGSRRAGRDRYRATAANRHDCAQRDPRTDLDVNFNAHFDGDQHRSAKFHTDGHLYAHGHSDADAVRGCEFAAAGECARRTGHRLFCH